MTRLDPEERGGSHQAEPRHPGLSPQEVLASGGWHPRYARVLITVSDGQAYFAYGRVPGRESVTVQFDQRQYEIPVSALGVWGFIKVAVNPRPGLPALLS